MPHIDTGRISLFFEDAGSGGTPVLLLHELGGSSESWRDVIGHSNLLGFREVAERHRTLLSISVDNP
jgi:pimeloyl-ACP methyl ester carboxylesterase